MKKILLDTNILIYIEDNKIIEEKVLELTKRLFDSNDYKIVIHPDTKREIDKWDDESKKIFLSKISVYKEIVDPPRANKSFNDIVGCKNSHDAIDNNMLYAVSKNCVSYLITNDKDLKKKSKKVNLEKKVLNIDEALDVFKPETEPIIKQPPFITYEYLYNLELDDPFFDSLKEDYKSFSNWFVRKQEEGAQAYVTLTNENALTSFLMLKYEDKNTDYSSMEDPLPPKDRLKVSTMKVIDTGKRIGETFIKIMVNTAVEKDVDEIYITVFEKQKELIDLISQYGFKYYTFQHTEKKDGTMEKELIYVKNARPEEEYYPFISLNNKEFFLVPIKEEYHSLLFPESEHNYQITLNDTKGMNTASNSLKKAYLSNKNINKIKPGAILLFYSTGVKKAVTTIGVVDAVFNSFNGFDDMFKLVRKRTAYDESELKKGYKDNKLVLMFKMYYPLPNYVTYEFMLKNNIVSGSIQSITEIDKNKFDIILEECKLSTDKYIIK